MNTYYIDLFANYLHDECKYPKENIRKNTYKYDGKEFGRVEVLSGEYVIQAFILMSDDVRRNQGRYPFYRSYYQRNDYGYLTPPACNIAVYYADTKKWAIYSSSDVKHELESPNFLNYDAAVKRFMNRLTYIGNEKLAKCVKWLSISLLIAVIMYVVAHILSINGLLGDVLIPLDSNCVGIISIITVLVLLPPLIPYIRSVTIGNVGVEINQGRK